MCNCSKSGMPKLSAKSSLKSSSCSLPLLVEADVIGEVTTQRSDNYVEGYLHRGDGYLNSICTSDSDNSSDESSLGFSLIWNPRDYVPIAGCQQPSMQKRASTKLSRASSEEAQGK